MNLWNSPCRKCMERYVGCHGKCERYIKAKAEHDEVMKQRKKENNMNAYVSDCVRKNRKRRKKK